MAQKISELAVNIRVDGLPQVEAATKKVDGAFSDLGKTIAQYLGPAALAATAVQLVRVADQVTLVNNRLRAAAVAGEDLAASQERVFRIAQASAVSLRDTADLYARIRMATRDIGATSEQVATATQAISDAFRIGGSSAQEAAAAAVQLGQALGSGRLNGDELRSILESSRPLAEAIAKEFGVSVGQLRQLGEQGQLVSDRVFRAILTAAGDFRATVQTLPMTVDQSLTLVGNSFSRLLGQLEQRFGVLARIAQALQGLSDAADSGNLLRVGLGSFASALRPGSLLGGSLMAGAAQDAAGQALRGRLRGFMGDAQDSMATRGGAGVLPTVRVSAPRPSAGQRPSGGGAVRSRVDAMPGGAMASATSQQLFRGASIGRPPTLNMVSGITDMIAANVNTEAVRIRMTLAEGIGDAMEQGLTAGIERAALSGSIEQGFKALTGTLLGGLGRSMIQFGLATMKIGALMEKIKVSLASFLPGGSVAAGAAMVALGAGFVALGARAAGQSFAGRGGAAIATGAAFAPTTERGTIGISAPGLVADGRTPISGTSVRAMERPAVNLTVIGPNDPTAQRGIAEIMKRVQSRGGV